MVNSNLYWSTDDMVRYGDTADKHGRLQDVIHNCFKILNWRTSGDEESALIVTDTEVSPLLYHTMAGALRTLGIEPSIAIQSHLETPNAESTPEVTEAMKATDLIINMMTYTITHSAAVEHAREEHGSAYLLLANPTEDSFTNGAVTAEPREVDDFAERVADAFTEGEHLKVTSPQGTDVEMSIEGRGPTNNPSYPTGETPFCPVEETVEGTIVHDSFMMEVGLLDEPITWDIEEGRITAIRGGREARVLRNYVEERGDENSYWIGEFSVGTNPEARPNGNYIEHKNVRGSCHFALGTGVDLGGKYRSSIHLDGVQLTPTVVVDGKTLIEEGEFTV